MASWLSAGNRLSSAKGLSQRTIADAYLFVILRWIDGTLVRLADCPTHAAYRVTLAGYSGIHSALAQQNM